MGNLHVLVKTSPGSLELQRKLGWEPREVWKSALSPVFGCFRLLSAAFGGFLDRSTTCRTSP